MLQKLALALFLVISAAILALLLVASMRPATYRIERRTLIAAHPFDVYNVVSDLHRFPEWSPWQDLDPSMRTDWSGPATGPGASYHWVGDDKVGEGRMTLRRMIPADRVSIALEFVKPFASTSDLDFVLQPVPGGTQVSWVMSGTNNFTAKLMTLFVDMDAAVGKDFEKGLGRLKTLVEHAPPPAAVPAPVDTTDEAFPDTAVAR